jgi:ABC-2 type transport system ATP-binding protein
VVEVEMRRKIWLTVQDSADDCRPRLTPRASRYYVYAALPYASSRRKVQTSVLLPEDDALFRALTIWEHLEMSGPLYGLSHEETEARATQLLRRLDLWRERGTYIEQASFGMRKKCALAMALLHNPRVLFLDEPFEGIDPGSSRNIKDLLLMLSQKGVTIFLTSHILEVVERLVGQYAIIIDGEIVCQQTVEETISAGRTLEDVYFQFAGHPAMEDMPWLG